MRVPKSLDQITLDQFQEARQIYRKALEYDSKLKDSSNLEAINLLEKYNDCWANILAVLADCQTEDIYDLPKWKFEFYIKQVAHFISNPVPSRKRSKYILVEGQLFKAGDESTMQTSEFIEVMTWLESKPTEAEAVYHKILASIYQPLKWKGIKPVFEHDGRNHEKNAALFKKVKFGKVYPTLFFFSENCERSRIRTLRSGLRKAQKEINKAQEDLMQTLRETLESIGAGTQ